MTDQILNEILEVLEARENAYLSDLQTEVSTRNINEIRCSVKEIRIIKDIIKKCAKDASGYQGIDLNNAQEREVPKMREILFKAKRKDNGKWVEGYFAESRGSFMFIDSGILYGGFEMFEVIPETVCQYSGLIDKNGKNIWENDTVKNDDGEVGIVRFGSYNDTECGYGDNNYGYYIEWVSEFGKKLKKNIAFWIESNFIEVIGNIFDNPELLEVEQ